MKEYKMLPIQRPLNASVIQAVNTKHAIRKFSGGRPPETIFYRILKLSEDKKTATICGDMTNLVNGQLSVNDVSVIVLGPNAVSTGDILGYKPTDSQFERPIITHRFHQPQSHPKNLIAPNE